MYRYQIGKLIFLTLSLWSGLGWAAPLRLAQDLWPPYVMNSALGSGIAHDLVTEALVSAGFEIEYSVKPWSRVLKETINGKNDVIIAIWKTEQRNKDYLFTEEYMYNQMAFISRTDTNFEYTSMNSLKGLRVALINNYAYGAGLRDYKEMIPADSIDLPNSIRLVLTDRADVLVTDEAVGRWTVKEMRIKKERLHFSEAYLDSTPLHAAVRKDHPQAEQIVTALNLYFKHHAEQKLHDLRIKYGLAD
ncbi:transporter substrate-binding domain-containing protein [Vibrio coralliilyticus]|uniref:substrate-binding periplasmic protein n=1 Tax=Vibrio coralliilyticus TaxID=190893 RepID=UPI00051288BD|nr:transporter substrate-binding domain-containing protein [Vibrio coralliilyticus]AIU66344.1 amino acid ABC transporter substrate-binding protein [Vibrio coralliilyticus]ANW25307.1 amino acid ABC transporter substrate-binding protein [Vibrio coralliilyticus]